MGGSEALALLRRRWLLLVLLLAVEVVTVGALGANASPRYWVRSEVVFVGPGKIAVGVREDSQTAGLVNFAGSVAAAIGDDGDDPGLNSASAPLYGIGVDRGYSVQLPNAGGQWVKSYTKPVLSVEVVDASASEVAVTEQLIDNRIVRAARLLQDRLDIPAKERIGVDVMSGRGPIVYVGRTRGGMVRGYAALTIVIVGVAVAVTAAADSHLRRRESRLLDQRRTRVE